MKGRNGEKEEKDKDEREEEKRERGKRIGMRKIEKVRWRMDLNINGRYSTVVNLQRALVITDIGKNKSFYFPTNAL